MYTGITVYPHIISSLGPGKGILFSQLINLCYANDWAKASGSDLSLVTGMPAKQCTNLLQELIADGLVRIDEGLAQVVRSDDLPDPDRKKKSVSKKSADEKEITAMGHALYANRIKANSDFVGNKYAFLNELKKMKIDEARSFGMAVDAWLEEVAQGKAVMGINTFLVSHAWKSYAGKGTMAHIEHLKTLIPMTDGGQYDVTSKEYEEFREAYRKYHSKENK